MVHNGEIIFLFLREVEVLPKAYICVRLDVREKMLLRKAVKEEGRSRDWIVEAREPSTKPSACQHIYKKNPRGY